MLTLTEFSKTLNTKRINQFSKKVLYRGKYFTPNKPIPSDNPKKKKMVLASKKVNGKTVYKKIHFGQKGYDNYGNGHKSEKRRKNYLTRSAGIRNKDGKLTKNDKFSPNYWSRKVLW